MRVIGSHAISTRPVLVSVVRGAVFGHRRLLTSLRVAGGELGALLRHFGSLSTVFAVILRSRRISLP